MKGYILKITLIFVLIKHFQFVTTNQFKVVNYRNISYLFKFITFIKLVEPVCL